MFINSGQDPDTATPVAAPEVAHGPAGAKALAGDGWLTLPEAAAELDLATETLRRRVRKGHLKVVPLGLGYRVSREELERVKREGFPYTTFVRSTKSAALEPKCKKTSKTKK